jgi:hypothetical protein
MKQLTAHVPLAVRTAVVVLGVVAVSACQPANPPVSSQPAVSAVAPVSIQPLLSSTEIPKVTVTVTESGGFVAWGVLPATPHVLHIADGVLYRPADPTVGTSILRGVLQRPVTAEQMASLVTRMQALGLFSATPIDAGITGKTDQGSITVVVTDGEQSYRHEIYAPAETDGIRPDQVAFREAFNVWMQDPLGEGAVSATGSPSDLVNFNALRLEVQSVGVVEREALEQQDNLNVARLWPLTDRLPEGCLNLTGEDARIVLDSLVDVTHETVWVNEGRWVRVALRGLLPGEPPCPSY